MKTKKEIEAAIKEIERFILDEPLKDFFIVDGMSVNGDKPISFDNYKMFDNVGELYGARKALNWVNIVTPKTKEKLNENLQKFGLKNPI